MKWFFILAHAGLSQPVHNTACSKQRKELLLYVTYDLRRYEVRRTPSLWLCGLLNALSQGANCVAFVS